MDFKIIGENRINEVYYVKPIISVSPKCSTWNNLDSLIVNSYLSVRSWSHMATDYNRNHRIFSGNVITHKIPKETNANENYLHSRWIERNRGRVNRSLVLVCLEVSSFITVLKGWSIYNLKTNGKVNRIKTNKV